MGKIKRANIFSAKKFWRREKCYACKIKNSKIKIYFISHFSGFVHLGAGLSVGLSGLAAGYAVGIVGDAGVRGTAQQPRLYVGMILILIFAEVLGLYGLIVAIYMIFNH